MSSVISICNFALTNVGKPEIQDINEESAEAKACKQFYAQTRDALLQSYPWSFARTVQALAEVANTKPRRWGHAYQRPSGCLKVRRVTDVMEIDYLPGSNSLIVAGGFAYSIEGDRVFCDIAPAYLDYTMRQADPTRYSPLFVDALSWQLAVRLAMPLTRDPKVRADAYQLAVQITGQAGAADANEERHVDDAPSRAIEAR